ncbi:hypothetical protein PPROV_000630700 [Pycnococcus provasolii]|uniref:Programmed cell death protein 5 n=1 Tax=Pycnococcus provasolii TaxID=41880 RepID=A0A830HLS0_9CHLO|nr:hypothetical protein PPROV_000630700 [Pycnococcus provasolii]
MDPMSDPQLEAIRQARMQQLQAGGGGGGGGGGGMSGGGGAGGTQEDEAEKQREMEQKRQDMLARCMQPAARERLHRVALVKPEKARGVEQMILMMASKGQLMEQVSEERLIQLLESISQREGSASVTITRKRVNVMDDDW